MTALVQLLWSTSTVERAGPAWLDAAESRRLERVTRAETRREFLTSRVLVKTLVAQIAGVDPADVRLGYTCALCGEAHGRPVVTRPHEATRVHVSLAHAGDRVVVAGSTYAPVGVDVEPVSTTGFDGFDAVALTPEERRRIRRLDEAARTMARATYWARKEALLKASGEGLNLDPSAVDVAKSQAQVRDLDLGRGYAGAVALLAREPIEVAARRVTLPAAAGAEPSRAASDAGAR